MFLTVIAEHGIIFEQAVAAGRAASSGRSRRETSLYAKSTERKALAARSDKPRLCTAAKQVRKEHG